MPFCWKVVDAVGWLATPEPGVFTSAFGSLAVQVTVVLLLFQPAPFAAGVNTGDTVGPVLSRTKKGPVIRLSDDPVHLLALKFAYAWTLIACVPSSAPAVNENVQDDFAVGDV